MRLVLLASSLMFVSILGCSTKDGSSPATGGRISPTYEGPAETAYCSTPSAYVDFVTITGTAQFKRREVSLLGLSSAAAATTRPIRAAEIRVTDASGAVIQCGETNSTDGTFSIQLPRGNANYTLSINSRALNPRVQVSVLNRPEQNLVYSLSTSVNASANAAIGAVIAGANGTTLGGAFNIFDQILEANEYLRSKVGTCSTIFPDCTDVTLGAPVPKVRVYWELGFNPNSYFGASHGLSFYLPGYRRIFILGGINGDSDHTDTDHYDNTIIVHEYGHFLEDSMFASDSPGGYHDGNAVVDPRLAWSEAWGNFIQAVVRNEANYRDTVGNADGSTSLAINVNIESTTLDTPQSMGEGNYREFAITRLLWDSEDNSPAELIQPGNVLDNVSGSFTDIWAALTKNNRGLRDSDFAFRSVGHVHLAQGWLDANDADAKDWTNLLAGHFHHPDTRKYANFLATGGACADFQIDPANADASTAYADSHLFRNNDFYHINIAATGSYTITLTYTDADGLNTEADLDLYVYNESAEFAETSDILVKSTTLPVPPVGGNEVETVTRTLSAGNYLINVNASSANGAHAAGPTNYNLKLNGVALCPVSLVQ